MGRNSPPAASHSSCVVIDPLRPNFGFGPSTFQPAARGRAAEIHVLMPLRDAQGNALVQIVFGETLGSRVHHAHELVAVAVFFVEQRSRMLGVELDLPRIHSGSW